MGLRRKKKKKSLASPTHPANQRTAIGAAASRRRRLTTPLRRRYKKKRKKRKSAAIADGSPANWHQGLRGRAGSMASERKTTTNQRGETKKQKQNDNNRKTSKPQKARPFNQSAVADRIQVRDNETTRVGKKEKNNDQTGIYETIERRLASTT